MGRAEHEELHFPASRGEEGGESGIPAFPPAREWGRSPGLWSRVGRSMEPDGRWRSLPSGPSLKHLTDPSYAIPPEQQKAALQDLTRAHVDSFNYAVLEGLSHAVQVSGTPSARVGPGGFQRVEEVAGSPQYSLK